MSHEDNEDYIEISTYHCLDFSFDKTTFTFGCQSHTYEDWKKFAGPILRRAGEVPTKESRMLARLLLAMLDEMKTIAEEEL